MKDNIRNDRRDDQVNRDQDQLRENTMNEMIRENSGDADKSLNDIRQDADNDLDSGQRSARRELRNTDITQGMSYTPNDASGVRSGGTVDMGDQTAGGAGKNTGRRRGAGSSIKPKRGTTGSDYDGQSPAI
jgi:hypothetical protein